MVYADRYDLHRQLIHWVYHTHEYTEMRMNVEVLISSVLELLEIIWNFERCCLLYNGFLSINENNYLSQWQLHWAYEVSRTFTKRGQKCVKSSGIYRLLLRSNIPFQRLTRVSTTVGLSFSKLFHCKFYCGEAKCLYSKAGQIFSTRRRIQMQIFGTPEMFSNTAWPPNMREQSYLAIVNK